MTKRTPRVLAAVVAATALTFTGVHTADAKPGHTKAAASEKASARGAKAPKAGQSGKLERTVARKVAQLERTVSAQRLRRVDPTHAAAVVAHVDADQAALLALLTAPAAGEDSGTTAADTGTATDVWATVKSYRVENYRLVVNILRQAAHAGDTTEAEDAALTQAVDLALAVTATSSKAEIRAARAALEEADELLEDDADEAEEGNGQDDVDTPDATDGPDDADEADATA